MFDKILHVVVRIALIGVTLCACNVVGFFCDNPISKPAKQLSIRQALMFL